MDYAKLIKSIETQYRHIFEQIDDIALYNQKKVLDAFIKNRISSSHFIPTTGYGYGDQGREKLCALFAGVFGTEDAIVSPYITGGTHALSLCLLGTLRPGDKVLSATGKPYDTLHSTIYGNGCGSLKDYGIDFEEIALTADGDIDFDKTASLLKNTKYKMLYVQRSGGYSARRALSIPQLRQLFSIAKEISPDIIILVDNCYGEFTSKDEPSDIGADLVAGSLIKNPGGGLAPTGGYICGKKHLIETIANRLTAPGLGMEVGSYAHGYKDFFQGLFLAPHITAQALKGVVLLTSLFASLGYKTLPSAGEMPADLIGSIQFDCKVQLINFCRAVQAASPVDSFVTPYPWDMPGYDCQVIMAAGAFVQGSSIELSCDAPIKEPYTAYFQGGLTYEHIKLALIKCLNDLNISAPNK